MNRDDLLVHFGFNQWANQRILIQMAKLSEAELKQPDQVNHGSAFQLLLHTLDSEWGWRIICQDGVATPLLWEVEELPDLDSVVRFWQVEHEQLIAYVQGLSDDGLDREIDLGAIFGQQSQSVKVWHLLTHILYHSNNHRSEFARYLTEREHSPGDIDFLDYVRNETAGG
jgi:uncharacterized damage-inducible protein DinB